MAREDDAEIQSSHSENTPLLVGEQSEQSEQSRLEQQENEKKPTSWYLWRVFWAIVAALFLAVFIKGWIDADGDANVSATKTIRQLR